MSDVTPNVTREEVRKWVAGCLVVNDMRVKVGSDDVGPYLRHILAALDDAERYGALRTRFADSLTRRVDHDTLWSASVTVTGLVGSVEINSFAGDKDALLRMKFDSIVDAARAGGA